MKLMVFARTRDDAKQWATDHEVARRFYEFVGSTGSLRGRATRDTPRVFVPGFRKRIDADEILEHLAIADTTNGRGRGMQASYSVMDETHSFSTELPGGPPPGASPAMVINITPSPGQSPEALAGLVAAKVRTSNLRAANGPRRRRIAY